MTADQDLLDDLLRVAAAAGTEADVAVDLVAARWQFARAPLVLFGADLAADGLRVQLPRRAGVIIVARVYNDAPAWDMAMDLGAEHVAVLPTAEAWLVERCASALRAGANGDGKVVAVIGGRGGAGASVLAAGLSVAAVREGMRTFLVDADPLGGGVDLLFGWEQEHGLRWPQLAEAGGHLDAQTLVTALPNRGDLVVLSCDRSESIAAEPMPRLLPDVMQVVLEAGRQGRDLIVVDLPRRLDEAAECALRTADHALMVVTPELRATSAAARVAGAVLAHRNDLSMVLRDSAPGRVSASEIAKTLDLPVVGKLRSEPRLAAALERGDPPAAEARGPLATFCRGFLKETLA